MQCRASCSRGVVPLPTNIFFGWLVSWQDQIHGHLKRLNDDTARDHIGFGWNLFARTPFFKLEIGSSGQVRKQIKMQECYQTMFIVAFLDFVLL